MGDKLDITLREATNAQGERLTTISGANGRYNGNYLTEAEYGRTHGSFVNLQAKNPSLFLEVRDHLDARVSDPDIVRGLREKLVAAGHGDVTLDASSRQVLQDAADPYGGVRMTPQPRFMLKTSPIPIQDGGSRVYTVAPDVVEDSKFLDKFMKRIPVVSGLVVGSLTMASGASASEVAVETAQASVPGADTGYHAGQALAACASAIGSSGRTQDRHLDNCGGSVGKVIENFTFGLIGEPYGMPLEDLRMNMDILKMGIDDMTEEQRLGFSEEELLSTKAGREYIASILPYEAENIEVYGAYNDELQDRLKTSGNTLIDTAQMKQDQLERAVGHAVSALGQSQIAAKGSAFDYSPS